MQVWTIESSKGNKIAEGEDNRITIYAPCLNQELEASGVNYQGRRVFPKDQGFSEAFLNEYFPKTLSKEGCILKKFNDDKNSNS